MGTLGTEVSYRVGNAAWCGRGRLVACAVVCSLLLAGCVAEGQEPLAETVEVVEIEEPVIEPTWSDGALYGLVEKTSQVARIDPGESPPANTELSDPLDEVGENVVVPSDGPDALYVPQPGMDQVLQIGTKDLDTLRTIPAGSSPSYLAVDEGSQMLLALSEDGATVTAVRLHGFASLAPLQVQAGLQAELDGPARGRMVEFFVAGPNGIERYKGPAGSVEKKDSLQVSVHTSAGDEAKVSRLYVGEEGTGRLLAVGVEPDHTGLAVVASTDAGEQVEHIGVDSSRVYVATEHTLTVLESDSFEGYGADASFSQVATIDFRDALPTEELEAAALTGIAVGEDHVYLSLQNQPYLISIMKPEI